MIMMKFLKFMAMAAVCSAFAFAVTACDDSSTGASDSEVTSSDSNAKSSASQPASSESKVSSSASTPASSAGKDEGLILRTQGAAENAGIYAFLITLNPKFAAEKGKVEILWFSSETGKEEQVLEYVGDYETNADGKTFNIYCTFNGNIDQNLKNKTELKISATVGATIRGDRLEVYYTPDGGKRELIYKGDKSQFMPK